MYGTIKQCARHGLRLGGRYHLLRFAESGRQIIEGQQRPLPWRTSSAWPPCCGAYLRNSAFKKEQDYHVAADLTGQANHLGVTIQADIIKQKLPGDQWRLPGPEHGGSSYGQVLTSAFISRPSPAITRSTLTAIRLPNSTVGSRWPDQLSGESKERGDLEAAVMTAAGQQACRGMGLISGRQGVPAADEGRRRHPQRHSGCVSRHQRDRPPEHDLPLMFRQPALAGLFLGSSFMHRLSPPICAN